MTPRFFKNVRVCPSVLKFAFSVVISFVFANTISACAADLPASQLSLSDSVNLGDWKAVRILCNERISKNPLDTEALGSRARINSYIGKRKDALVDCNKVLSVRPLDFITLYLRGCLLYEDGKFKAGKDDLISFLKLTAASNDLGVKSRRAFAYRYLKDYESAKKEEQVVLNSRRSDDIALFFRADSLEHIGKFKQAEEIFSALKERHRLSPLVLGHYAFCQMQNGKFDIALRQLTDLVKVEPKFVAAYAAIGDIFERQENRVQAILQYSKALEIDAFNKYALEHRALCYSYLEEYSAAISDVGKAIALDPEDAYTFLSRAYIYDENGFFKESVADCNRALLLNSKIATGWYQLACAEGHLKNWKKAKAACEQAIKLSPKYLAALCEHAWIVKEMGDHKAALKEYDAVIRIDPKYASAYYSRGYLFREDKQYSNAIADLTKAIELNPTNEIYYCSRGCANVRKGNYKKAIEDCTQSIKLNPKRAHPYFSRGEAYLALAKYKLAADDFTSAIGTYSKYWEAFEKRAEAYKKLNKVDLANRDLERSKQIKLADKD